MINGMNIFYNSTIGRELKLVSTNAKGLEPIQTKKGRGTCNKKCNKKQFKGKGLKILQ